ncbi:unnamed protein product [Prunus armeniaca]
MRNRRYPFETQMCPRAGSVWVSEAITHYWKNSKSQLKTPTLGETPYLEPLLFLDLLQKLTGSGRNLIPKPGRNPIQRSDILG